MSPALPVMSGKATLAALERAGFAQVSQKGSHVKIRHLDGRIAIIPMHKELAPGTLRSVIRQSGMTVDEFLKLLQI